MDFVDVHPLASCTAGGRMIMMISNNTLAEDIIPIFQVFSDGAHRPDLDQFLVQPTRERGCAGSVLSFCAPPQPQLEQLEQGGEAVKIKLSARDGGGRVSSRSWDFVYRQHGGRRGVGAGPYGYQGTGGPQHDCMFCEGRVD